MMFMNSFESAPSVNSSGLVTPQGGTPENLSLPLYGASPKQAITRFFKRYAKFEGRSSRSEYWWAYLALSVISVVLMGIATATATVKDVATTSTAFSSDTTTQVTEYSPLGNVLLIILAIIGLATLIPSISSAVRRLHDANYSGWLYLLVLVPILGPIAVMVLLAMPSKPEGQRFDGAAARQQAAGGF